METPARKTLCPIHRAFAARDEWVCLYLLCFAACAALQAQSAPKSPTFTLTATSPWLVDPSHVRSGVPVVFSARLLPADATGTLTLSVDGIPTQTLAVAPRTPRDYTAIGDAITYAGFLADPSQRYQTILGGTLGSTPTTYGQPGSTACSAMYGSVIANSLGASTTANPLYSLLLGSTEANTYGAGANEALFNLCYQGAVAWLGVSRPGKVLIGDAGVAIRGGSWTSAPAWGNSALKALTEATGSGTVRFSLNTSGGAAYLWYLLQFAAPGSLTVSVDGGPSSAETSTCYAAGTLESIAGSYAMLRIPVAAGSHTFDIAAESGTVSLLGMGTATLASLATVLAADVPAEQPPHLASAIAEYSSDIAASVSLLRGDGLDLRFAPTAATMLAAPAEMMDTLLPNALGLAEIAQALAAAATSSPIEAAIPVAGANFMLSGLSLGSHQIAATYSGDSNYAAISAAFGTLAVYNPTATVALSTTSPLVATQTPITLTASVPQPNADGAVDFLDISGGGSIALGTVWLDRTPTVQLTLPSLAAGPHTLAAQFTGGAYYSGATSPPVTLNVSGTYTSTSLTAPATRFFGGAPVPLTATVSRPTATGSVVFSDGATALGQASVTGGIATFSAASLATGIHALTASYSGDNLDDLSQSPVLSIEIDANPTTIALAPLPASATYGSALTLSATVSGAAPNATDSVTFADKFVATGQSAAVTQTLGQSALANGNATLAPTLAPGTHTLMASYSGDALNLPAISSPMTTRITLAASSVTLAPIPASIFGAAVTLSAAISPAAATGTVTFADSVAGTLGHAALVDGAASLSPATLAPGLHTLTAAYSGDGFRAPSTSAEVGTTVSPAAAAIALAALPASIDAGNPVVLTATILPTTATGSVVFRDATQGVLGESVVAQGKAALTLPAPSTGAYAIAASYSGDTNDAPATSATVTAQVVANPVVASLSASASTATVGSALTLTVTLSSASATGIVTFFDGTAALGTALVASGKASLSTSSLAAGVHSLHAAYGGDSVDAPATSAPLAETIAAAASSTTLSLAQASVIAGTPVAVDVRVAGGYATPSGTVTLRSGSAVLASTPLANAAAGAAYATFVVSSASLGIGTFPLTAFYVGDANDQPSDSSAALVSAVVVAIPTTAALTLSANQVLVGGSVTLTVALTSSAGIPTGSVSFLSGGEAVATASLNSGTASATLTSLPIGVEALTASYTPTGLFAASASAAQSLDVTPPLIARLNPTTLSASPGASVAATLLLTPLSGFTGALQTQCQASSSAVTCTVDAPATIGGAATVSAPVHISIANSGALLKPLRPAHYAPLFVLLLPLLSARRGRRVLSLLAFGVLASFFLSGCAEGGDFFSVVSGTQTVTVTVTAAGTSIPASMTVNIGN